MKILIYGLGTGILFGFFLQRARVIRYNKQLGALRLMDMTIVKFMITNILVGMVGVYLLKDLGWASLSIKPTILGGNILGGLFLVSGGDSWVTVPAHRPGPWERAVGMRCGASWGCWQALPFLPRPIPGSRKRF